MSLTQEQQKKLNKIAKIEKALQGNVVSVFEHVDTVENEIKEELKDIKDTIENLDIPKRLTIEELKDIIEPLIPVVEDGKDYVLTYQDKQEIASYIEAPVVEKIIEKTTETVIREQPIEIIKEVAVLDVDKLPQFGDKFRDGLELLQGEERLDKNAIKGLEDYQEVAKLAKDSVFLNRGGNGKGLFSQQNDVKITDPTNGQVPIYNSTTGKWENGDSTGGGIESVVAGTNISVDNTDPSNPIINSLSDRYKTTSSTSNTIAPNGTKTFTVDSNLAYIPEQDVIIVYDSSNHMHGVVTSYSGTTLVVSITHKTGSGTYSSWVINLDGIAGSTLLSETPTLLTTTGNVNNLALPTAFIVFTGTSAITLSGLDATGIADGQEITILNNDTTSRSFTITHNSTGSTAANRFSLPNNANISLRGGFAIKFKYVSTNSRWYASAQTLTATYPLSTTGSAVSIPQATDTVAGYLASSDWTAFNGKPNFYSALIDEGAIAFSNTGPATYPTQLSVDRDQIILNRTVGGTGFGIARADVDARIHAKTPPSSTITDVTGASLSFTSETPAGTAYYATANMDIPYIQRAISPYISPIASTSTFTAGDTLDYQIWAYDNLGTYCACAGIVQQVVGTTGDDMQIYWTAGTMLNSLAGFKILRQINGGGFTDAYDAGNVTSYTDSGFTGGDLTITPTAADFVSNGTTWTFTPSGVNLSPTGGAYKSAAGSTYGFYDNNTGDAYRTHHDIYVYSPSTGVFVSDGTNAYISATNAFDQDTTTFTSISTPPEHYGILSNGTDLTWDINLYERQVISGRAYYSINPQNLTNTDPNTGIYLYATLTLPNFTESTKILLSVNGGAYTSLIDTTGTQYIDIFNFPFSGDTVITPTNVYRPVQILEQQADSEDDPSALIIKGLNGYQSITFLDSTDTQLAKMIVGTDGSVDFICSSLKVNGTPV